MNLRLTGWLVAVLVLTSWSLRAQEVPSAPIHTSKSRFRIPFRFDERELQRIGAREVRLYVSTDGGQTWKIGGTTNPTERRFDFTAPGDGTYWFAVRTVDVRSQLHPAGPITEPALKVVVDTRPPKLSVDVREIRPGRVQLVWQADDLNLDTSRLRLEYREPGQTRWQAVSIVPQANGRTSWSVPGPGVVAVRGTVSDFAGNPGRAESSVNLGGGVAPRDPVPDLRQPIADGVEGANNPPRTADRGDLLINDDPEQRPTILRPRYDDPSPSSANSDDSTTDEWPAAAPSRARLVNTRTFSIDYELSDVGPSGVGAVEFFITTDDGKKWWRYGEDEDRRSPFEVTVPRDGVYGFSLRARSGVGLAGEPPQPGEKPAIVVAVDRTPPEASFLGIEQGRGAALDQVLVRWTSREANPAEKPITLEYSVDGNRWEPIVGWIGDAGRYTWRIPQNGPARFHLRLTVRDAAGNQTHVKTDQPIIVDLARPSARIVDVQPADSANR